MQPENQNQHRVPQIYLKQFGHFIENKWIVSVYKPGNAFTENLQVSRFTADFNIFDAPYGDIALRRNFEIQCSRVENFYRVIISNLKNQKQLTLKDAEVLCHFIATLLSRSVPFTDFIQMILRNKRACKRFIDEIGMFNKNKEILEEALKIVPIHLQLNAILGTITAHFVEVFSQFNFLILEKPTDIPWMTTDNPVILDHKGNMEWLVSADTEIYLPLSRDFCLFGFHESADNKANPLRKLKQDKVNKIDIGTFEMLQKKIGLNLSEYLVMPIYLEDSEIR